MKHLLFFISFGVLLSESYASGVIQKTDTSGRRILIINAFDASQMKARNNKKELFAELADSLKQYLYREIRTYANNDAVVAEGPLQEAAGNNIISLLQKYNCTSAVVINSLNVYFEQTDVDVTKNSDGSKSRTASYNLCTEIQYGYYKNSETLVPLEKRNCKHFTTRNVASGILAAGPDVVGKSKYTFTAVYENAESFVKELIYR